MTTIQHTERLNRIEADIVVRQITGEFHNRHGVKAGPDSPLFRDFCRKLAWQIGGDDTVDFRDYIVDALHAYDGLMDIIWGDQPHGRREAYEGSLNVAVSGALGAAGLGATGIRRHGDQRDLGTGLHLLPTGLLVDPVRFSAMAKSLAAVA